MAKRNVTGTVTGVFLWTVVIGGSLVFGYMYAGNHTLPFSGFHWPSFGAPDTGTEAPAQAPVPPSGTDTAAVVQPVKRHRSAEANEYVAPGAPRIAITEVPASQPPSQDTDSDSQPTTSNDPGTSSSGNSSGSQASSQPSNDQATTDQTYPDNQGQINQQPAVQQSPPVQSPSQSTDQSSGQNGNNTPDQNSAPTFNPPVQGNPPRRRSALPTPINTPPTVPAYSTGDATTNTGSSSPGTDDGDSEASQSGIASSGASLYRVQAGTFTSERNAKILADALRMRGYTAIARSSRFGGQTIYKVQVGVYQNRATAEDIATDLLREGYPAYVSGN